MKTTTTNRMKTTKKTMLSAGKLFCLSLALTVAGMTSALAQRSTTVLPADEDVTTEQSMKNPGTGQQPIKNFVPGPIGFCPTMSGFQMIDKSYAHIIMGWDNIVNFDSIMIRVTETGTSNSRIISMAGNPNAGRVIVTGLVGLTTYDLEVSTKCHNGTISNWSAPVTVTTFAEPAPRLTTSRNSNNLSVFPNPAAGYTNIGFTAPAHVPHQVRIINSNGVPVMKTVVSSGEGKIQLPVDLTGFTPGLYFVQVQSGANIFSKRLLVL